MFVYLVTNTVNGKRYVGQTSRTLKARWQCHVSDAKHGSDFPLHRAMRKYGVEAFTVEPLGRCDDKENLDTCERLLIRRYKSRTTEHGYNATDGGEGITGHHFRLSPDERARRAAHCRVVNIGRRHTNEWKEEMRRRNAGSGNPFHGRKHTTETLTRMSGANHWTAKRKREDSFK